MPENNYRQFSCCAGILASLCGKAGLFTTLFTVSILIGCASTPRYSRTTTQPQKDTSTAKSTKVAPKPAAQKKSTPQIKATKPHSGVPVQRAYAPEMRIPSGPQSTPPGIDHYETEFYQKGTASYYANKFHGRKTASGERYNKNAMTAAHPRLPFNSVVKVTNTSNNKSVIVRINDRGPFSKNRIIDISRAAAVQLDLISKGVTEVVVEIVKK